MDTATSQPADIGTDTFGPKYTLMEHGTQLTLQAAETPLEQLKTGKQQQQQYMVNLLQ